MQIWYPTHPQMSPVPVLIKSATYCNNNSHQTTSHPNNTVPPSFQCRGLFMTTSPSLILSPASLSGFQTPLLHLLIHHLRQRSPSLCGTPRALSGLKYDMITANTTITQQCGRIVAASGAAPPSERRCRLSVSSSPPSSRHALCRLRAHAVSVSLSPPPPLLPPLSSQ